MRPRKKSKKRITSLQKLKQANSLCESLSEEDEAMTREMMTGLADKWSLWTLSVLAMAEGPLRFTRVMEQVEGISQKSLTKALRQLERDGLATRKMFPEVPPRVEYAVTPLGIELLEQIEPLWRWVADRVRVFHAARQAYDSHKVVRAVRSPRPTH
jgi:DNA-binding HxlR family transcriptional regulator